jgi:hypothetical protein
MKDLQRREAVRSQGGSGASTIAALLEYWCTGGEHPAEKASNKML